MNNPFISNLQNDPRIRGQVSQLRAGGQLGVLWKAIAAATATENADRKKLVLQYDDLARRIAKVLRLPSPDMWNGRLPAATIQGKTDYTPNPSSILAQLREIVAEAEARQQQNQAAA
jgi:hypothetical protein